MNARAQGLNWQPIQAQYFPNKTANACRKRHERLMDRRNSDENMAKEYMGMRREIWTQLGNKTGEKWNVVEAKVFLSSLLYPSITNILPPRHSACNPASKTYSPPPAPAPDANVSKTLPTPARNILYNTSSIPTTRGIYPRHPRAPGRPCCPSNRTAPTSTAPTTAVSGSTISKPSTRVPAATPRHMEARALRARAPMIVRAWVVWRR
jgi:hypothetical protein